MPRTKKIVSKKTTPTTEKKATPKRKTVTTKVAEKKVSPVNSVVQKIKGNPLTATILKIVGIVIGILLVVMLADYAVQYVRNEQSIAVVNGKRISKAEWHRVLEMASGPAAAQSLINDSIVLLEAKKEDVKVGKDEIDKRVDEIRQEIGGEEAFQAALEAANYKLDEFEDQVRMDMYYTKLIGPTIKYTDDDIKNFFEQYSSVLFEKETSELKEGEKLDYEKYKDQTTEYYITQMVSQEKQGWLLTKSAEYSIQDNSTEKPSYKFFGTISQIMKNLSKEK